MAPNAGNYWTQFGSAGYRLPSNRPAVGTYATTGIPPRGYTGVYSGSSLSTPADIAPTLSAPATPYTTNYGTTTFSVPGAAGATPWTPVGPTSTTTGYGSDWQPTDSGSCAGCNTTSRTTAAFGSTSTPGTAWQTVPNSSSSSTSGYTTNYPNTNTGGSNDSYAGATDWMSADEYEQRFRNPNDRSNRSRNDRKLESVPADRAPRLQDDRDSESFRSDRNTYGRTEPRYNNDRSYGDRSRPAARDLNADRRNYDRQPREYEDQFGGSQTRGTDPAIRNQRYLPAARETVKDPFVRPIPDFDRNEFDTAREQQPQLRFNGPEITASLDQNRPRSNDRWIAEPLRPVAGQRDVQRPSSTPKNVGGWRSVR